MTDTASMASGLSFTAQPMLVDTEWLVLAMNGRHAAKWIAESHVLITRTAVLQVPFDKHESGGGLGGGGNGNGCWTCCLVTKALPNDASFYPLDDARNNRTAPRHQGEVHRHACIRVKLKPWQVSR